MKIRVMQVLDSVGIAGGAQRMAVDLTLSLDPERFDPCFVSFFPPAGTTLEEALAANSIRTYYLGKRLGFEPRIFLAFDRVLRRERPHVVHTHVGALRYAFPSLLLRRVPAALHTIHIRMPRSDPLAWVDRFAFSLGVTPVTIAPEVALSLGQRFEGRGAPNIPNGIHVGRFKRTGIPGEHWRSREELPPDAVLFANIARCDDTKNQTLLIDAFAKMCGDCERARLLFVGDGPLLEELQAYTGSRGLERRVHFLGYREDIPDILHAVDVFVLCSRTEVQPLSVMEAMAAGRPVIASRVGGMASLVDDGRTGILFESGDADALAAAMQRLALDPSLAASMGREGATRAEREFDIEAMARAYEGLYLKLLGERERRWHTT
jgi:glycosyltransferase involved in cell wall biosynthesis